MITKKWRRMAEIYKRFAKDYIKTCDFSDQAAQEMFDYESNGTGDLRLNIFNKRQDKFNGYAVGKHWMDVTIAMWKEDIKSGILAILELIDDGFPSWWLIKIGILDEYVTEEKVKQWKTNCMEKK